MNSDSEQPSHSSISEMLEAAAAKRVELSNRWGFTPVLQHDPKAVLEAARVEYIEEGNLGGF